MRLSDSDPMQALAFSNCAREPIHTPGTIQSFGTLLVSSDDLTLVTHVAENFIDYLKSAAAYQGQYQQSHELLGQSVETVLSEQLLHDIRNLCELSRSV